MIRLRITNLFVVAMVGLLFSTCWPMVAGVSAAELNSGLKITPLRSYPTQQPGETKPGSITLSNLGKTDLQVHISTETFKVTNENYDYSFGQSDYTKWVRFVNTDLTLLPDQSQAVAYTIDVPVGAEAGGYYLAVIAATTTSPNSSEIQEVRRVASLLYLEVSGDIKVETKLLSFDSPWFLYKPEIPVSIRIANTGTSHNRSRVQVSVSRWPFHGVGDTKQLESVILPASVRGLEDSVKLSGFPGIYKLAAEYAAPQGGVSRYSKTILYIPPWFVGSIVVIGVSIIILLRRTRFLSKNTR